MMHCSSLTLALLCIQVICGDTVLHHITPSPSIECPIGESCLTLSTFAASINNYTDSNTTLLFLAGDHIFDSNVSVSNITLLRLSNNYSQTEIPTIVCIDSGQVKFAHIAQVQIHNLNFIGCSSVALSVHQFVLENSSFHGANGSALILNQIFVANIVDSSFTSNNAGTYVDSTFSRVGGALVISETNIKISRSWFVSNVAQLGGAIFIERYSNVTINDSLFADNSAMHCYGYSINCYGGAFLIDSSCIVTAHNNTFVNNTSEFSGGAIALFQATYIDLQNAFHYNGAYDHGGVIYAFSSSITVSKSYYSSNRVGSYGAAIYAQNSSQLMAINSVFRYNYAEGAGGAISACFNSSVTAYYSSFESNEAAVLAGIVHASTNCSIVVNGCSFSTNKATYGAVMYMESNVRLTVESSSFNSNFATYDVGVFVAFSSNITVNQSIFTNNTAINDVGVVYATDLYDVTINNSFFQNNKAGADGGVLYVYSHGRVTISNSSFLNNEASFDGGVAYAYDFCHISFENCTFLSNTAYEAGVIFVRNAFFEDFGSTYIGNRANINGGAITLTKSDIEIRSSTFISNTARLSGGVLYTPIHRYEHTILLEENNFERNKASSGGVVALFNLDILKITKNNFSYNQAKQGGVLYLYNGNAVTIKDGSFSNNSASSDGGVIHLEQQNSLTIINSVLNFNSAGVSGGVLYSLLQNEITITGNNCTFIGNQAHSGGVIRANDSKVNIQSQTFLMENNIVMDAGGAMYLSNTNLTLFSEGDNVIMRNRAKSGGGIFAVESNLNVQSNSLLIANNTSTGNGGGVWLSRGQLVLFSGINELVENEAENGGGVYASQSRLLVETDSFTQISSNMAMFTGGGLYLTSSTFEVGQNTLYIARNRANERGGGLHAANSSIIIEGVLHCVDNQARNGGGFSLERYTKFYGKSTENNVIDLISNIASDYGGALYIDDETNPDICAVDTLQNATSKTEHCFIDSLSINSSDNFAGVSGSNLFGGLLDRCRAQSEFYKTDTPGHGLALFQQLSNASLDTISSHPVRMCFCRDSQPDCNYQPEPIQVQREMAFSVELIAYDHVNHTVNATISSSLNSSAGGLGKDQGTRYIHGDCTKLEFTLFSPLASEELMFTLKGPCNVTGISKRSIRIEVKCQCPIGFQILNDDKTACECICDDVLQPYARTECNTTTQSIIRRDEFWITYINHTNSSGYVIYPYCPLDYCYTPGKQVSVNLNLPNGSNAQCVSHRSGTLCGSCKPGHSVSLGGSHCLQCPPYWPWLVATIVVVFILSGIALVAFLLILNLTVAIGTINAVIFYANVMAASKSALFPSGVSFASVLISWINFDLGFEMCFFDGMDTYIKTWLQLAFPAYIIILVAIIIKLSYHFTWFGRLVGRKDPVATLATLILLSYTKLLQAIITSFSSATLTYPDGSRKTVWLPDASIGYFTLKHALLFCTAIVILLLGLAYTLLIFTWQWILRFPRRRVKWITNPRLCSFLEIYHVPYAAKHRYWTGLLLFVRVILYLVSAFNPSGDPRLTLLSTAFIVSFLFLYIAIFGVWMYKNWYINAMETLTYFNIIAVSIVTLYSLGSTNISQTAVTNVSVAIIFAQMIAVISFHACKYTMLSNIQKTKIYEKISTKFQSLREQKRLSTQKPPLVETNIHRFHELLDAIDRPVNNTNDYNIPQVHPKPAEPTQSVVELPKPNGLLGCPTPLEKITEEPEELKSGSRQHLSEGTSKEDESTMIMMYNQSSLMDDCCRIKTTECNGSITSAEAIRVESPIVTMVEEGLIAKRHSPSHVEKNSMDAQEISA